MNRKNNEAILIYPHQLFQNHPALIKNPHLKVFLVEDFYFFRSLKFHKNKLILHRASMRAYQDFLKKRGHTVVYVDCSKILKTESCFALLAQHNVTAVHLVDTIEQPLEKIVTSLCKQYQIKRIWYDSPMFLTPKEISIKFFSSKKHFSMASFYQMQRKRLGILIDGKGKPLVGKWSFDAENRNRVPHNLKIPRIVKSQQSPYVLQARIYIEKHFPENYGHTEEFFYPITFFQAKKWLKDFLTHRLTLFGEYEDAIVKDELLIFHSLLTPMLNIGLLTPDYVVHETLMHAKRTKVPLNSLEGFLRQVIGWREFMHACYVLKGKEMRHTNFWKHTAKMPRQFWQGSTGIEPVDITIKKVIEYGYCHHIERLMILGNFMLLCKVKPDDVYAWFMELFIDAYDWVMVPNVYAMSQYADGGTITTKPYISSSNYIIKMSNYTKGTWCNIWDALYWDFISTHKTFFKKNPRLRIMVSMYDKMEEKKRKHYEQETKKFFDSINVNVF